MINIIQRRKISYLFSGLVIIAGIIVIATMGLRLGIDFTGGSLLEVRYTVERPAPEEINEVVAEQSLGSLQLQAVNTQGYLLRLPDITDQQRRDLMEALRNRIGDDGSGEGLTVESGEGSLVQSEIDLGLSFEEDENGAQNRIVEERFETIGPVIGRELVGKSFQAIIVVLIAILIYIAWAFRKVSWPVQSWKYGLVALITLFHDVLIVFGVYTLLTHLYGWELNTAFVAAILTILGYSVNDTIVVFDRIRENVPRESGTFEEIVNLSVNQTLSRSLITSLTTLFVLLAVVFIGGASIQSFVAALSIGVVVGTYSSIFIASPLLVSAQLRAKGGKKKAK